MICNEQLKDEFMPDPIYTDAQETLASWLQYLSETIIEESDKAEKAAYYSLGIDHKKIKDYAIESADEKAWIEAKRIRDLLHKLADELLSDVDKACVPV